MQIADRYSVCAVCMSRVRVLGSLIDAASRREEHPVEHASLRLLVHKSDTPNTHAHSKSARIV